MSRVYIIIYQCQDFRNAQNARNFSWVVMRSTKTEIKLQSEMGCLDSMPKKEAIIKSVSDIRDESDEAISLKAGGEEISFHL